MLKKEEKKKEETFSFKIVEHLEGNYPLKHYEEQYSIDMNGTNVRVIINLRTSSCGSIQISFMNTIKHSVAEISKQNRLNFFNHILDKYEDHNHFYFIDQDNGLLEEFFGDLGFSKVWSYLNYNSENHVHMWCYNKWTDDEVREKLDTDDEYDDDGW